MPDAAPGLTRRRLLSSGLAAGAGMALSGRLGALVETAYAAQPTACAPLSDIEHVVILIQENRSFDHYFGAYRGVRGFTDPRALRQPEGLPVFAQPGWAAGRHPAGHLLPYHLNTSDLGAPGECVNDISHEWPTQHASWHGGAMDGFVTSHLASNGPGIGPLTMGYYTRSDLSFYYALADAFTLCDAYHCSVIGPTDPNRLYSMSGTLDPDGRHGGPVLTTSTERVDRFGTLSWTTMPEVLQEAGVSWKTYCPPDQALFNPLPYFKQYNDPASPVLFGNAFGANTYPATFAADVAAGTLPAVSWVMSSALFSEHPSAPPRWGEALVAQVLQILLTNRAVWEKTALLVTFDENGGFFDHVPPPVPPPGTDGEYLTVDPLPADAGGVRGPIGLGFRVPMLVVSPYSRGGYVCSEVFDHTSTLRFLEARFGVTAPNLTAWRRATVGDLTGAFSFGAPPRPDVPSLPAPALVDPVIVRECVVNGGSFGIADKGPTYPVPPNSWPHQERGTAPAPVTGACAVTPHTRVAGSRSTASRPPLPARPEGRLPATGAGRLLPTLGLAAAAAAATLLRRRDAAASASPTDGPG